ncbi:hypothetical protein CEUSTIGMA_g5318.t1 [Chlamydomonas eustigma]|uniref:Uncharacterized protein n=1 Tax=Chlamydomonas eustigma TaxID=1157962 RepID=A0A250X497_9CHLO|nr:hypothetical protein CEUSTIGMA_g5318.t1 [Chlamydomonas eustigma]|eukprot:GAX77876.1 hypothetical protein CEUSTIGMA_g5318.t1 [Chlamydomonas eustigma]
MVFSIEDCDKEGQGAEVLLMLSLEDVLDSYVMGPLLKISHIIHPSMSIGCPHSFQLRRDGNDADELCSETACSTTSHDCQMQSPQNLALQGVVLTSPPDSLQLPAAGPHLNARRHSCNADSSPSRLPTDSVESVVATTSKDDTGGDDGPHQGKTGVKWWGLTVVEAKDLATAERLHCILERQLCVRETRRRSCACPMLGF